MTRNEFITILNDINDKFKTYSSEKNINKVYFDVLHMTLLETINAFSDEAWDNMPNTIKNTVDRLQNLIYFQTSYEYKKDREKDLIKAKEEKEQKKSEPQEEIKTRPLVYGVKYKIGFSEDSFEV